MRLVTTMGVELTWVPTILDKIADLNNGYDSKLNSVDDLLPDTSSICSGYARMLSHNLNLRKIKYRQCSRDPDCVEMSTFPYKNLDMLMKTIRSSCAAAEEIDLKPTSEWFNGGGCHIHAGLVGKHKSSALQFGNRIAMFCATNPWLSWAFVGIVDDMNAEPLTLSNFIPEGKPLEQVMADHKDKIRRAREKIIAFTQKLHSLGYRDSWSMRRLSQKIVDFQIRIAESAKVYMSAKLQASTNCVSMSDEFGGLESKDQVLRITNYGEFGTAEFRAFEMPEDISVIKKYLLLVNAICQKVNAQTFTSFNLSDIPTRECLDCMPWSKRRAGFIAMLEDLGLNPDDFREERIHMALRMRYWAARRRKDGDSRYASAERVAEHVRRVAGMVTSRWQGECDVIER